MATRRPLVRRAEEEPSAARDTRPSRVWAVLGKARADPKTAVTLAGLVLYAVVWSAYEIFYQSLGLTPHDLGFGYLDLLAQTAVGAVGLTIVVGALLSIYIVLFPVLVVTVRAAKQLSGHSDGDETSPEPEAGAVSEPPLPRAAPRLGSAAAVVGVALFGAMLAIGGVARVAATYGAACVVAGVWIALAASWLKDLDAAGRARLQRHLGVGAVVSFLLVAAVLLAQAAADGNAVRQGRGAHPTALGFRLGSWGAERATVRWVREVDTDARRVLDASCLMYLGTSDGTAYLYAPRARETLRLPAGEVAIATRDATEPCAGS